MGLLTFLLSGTLITFGATVMRMGLDQKALATEYCPQRGLLEGGKIKSMVPSSVLVDIEDGYVRWGDDVFCRGNGLAECPCVEVQQSLWT